MSEFIIYALKSVLALGLFALAYKIFLIKEGNFINRRIYLLFSVGLAMLIPFVRIPLQFSTYNIPSVLLDEVVVYSNGIRLIRDTSTLPVGQVIKILYFLIAGFLVLRIIISTVLIIFESWKNNSKEEKKVKLYQIKDKNISYSFFRNIFIGQTSGHEEMERILAHEKIHALQLHSIDVMFIEFLSSIFWFNPLIWWYRNEIKNVHEYLADQGALENGFNKKEYQITLLEHLIGSASLTITNSFNFSLIKNRIAMMNKEKSNKKNSWKLYLLLPLTLVIAIAFACTQNSPVSLGNNELENMNDKTAYFEVEQMPEFPGGIDAIRKLIATNLSYPVEASKNGVSGKVFVQFVVDQDAKIVTNSNDYVVYDETKKESSIIGNVIVVGYKPGESSKKENVDQYVEQLKMEAVRVISSLPDFEKPGMKNGKPVAVVFTIPINFVLQ